jgi:hypothetical protein
LCESERPVPPISPGSLILLEEIPGAPEIQSDATKTGWSSRVYALRRGADLLCGYLDRNDNRYVLLAGAHGSARRFRSTKMNCIS